MGDWSDMYNMLDPYDERDIEDDIYINCIFVAETPKAWLLKDTVNNRQAWFPKSQCVYLADQEAIQVPHWLTPDWKEIANTRK